MKKLSITDSEKKLLFIVLALGILAAAYFLGFTKLNEAAAVIEASNVQDQATVSNLEGMVARQAETEAETEGFKRDIQTIIDKYPSAIPQEKSIYLIQEMQDIIGVDVSSIAFRMDTHVQSFSGDNPPIGKYNILALAYTCDYDQFKQLLDYVAKFPDRTTIPSITAAYDESTGGMRGSLNYKMLYLENSGKKYEEFPPTEIPSGKVGIFYPDSWSPQQELEEFLDQITE